MEGRAPTTCDNLHTGPAWAIIAPKHKADREFKLVLWVVLTNICNKFHIRIENCSVAIPRLLRYTRAREEVTHRGYFFIFPAECGHTGL
jgi:hypothetical protein